MTSLAAVASASAAVGTVFCSAAVAKLMSGPAPLEKFLGAASVPLPVQAPLARVLPYIELVIGVALIIWPGAWTAAPASLVAIAFLATLLWAARQGVTESCHCFGAIDARAGNTPVPLVRAVILAASCVAVLSTSVATGRLSGTPSAASTAIGILTGAAFVAIASLGGQVWGLRTLHADMVAVGVMGARRGRHE